MLKARYLFLSSLIALGLALPAAPSRAAENRLTLQWSNDGTLLVVGDSDSRTLAFYKVEGKTVTLIASRNLAQDMAGEVQKPGPAAPALPASDMPGEDPPGLRRPERSVRISANCNLEASERETWNATYVVQGTVEGVYGKLRTQFGDWKFRQGGIRYDSYSPRGDLSVSRDDLELGINVGRGQNLPEGWVQIQVNGTRRKKS